MEEIELINIWKAYDKKIEEARILNMQSWALNFKCYASLQTQKAKSKMDALARFKGLAVIIGISYILLLALLIYFNHGRNLYFSISLGLIMGITILVTSIYIRHIFLIRQIKYDKSLTETQNKLSVLQSSTIQTTRIAWLQMPFYSTWFWSSQWVVYDNLKFWEIAFPITLFFTLLTIWLYRNISVKNIDRKWFRILFNSPEWKSVRKSMEFMKEIEMFKEDMV